jgi:hypothetical protein
LTQKNDITSSKYIYESPDNGDTVYRRKHGQYDRELYIQKEPDLFSYADLKEIQEFKKNGKD